MPELPEPQKELPPPLPAELPEFVLSEKLRDELELLEKPFDELGRLELPELLELLELPKELLPPLPAELPELDLLEKLLDELEWLELLRPPPELLPDAPPLANLLPPPPLFLYKSYHQNLYLSPKT